MSSSSDPPHLSTTKNKYNLFSKVFHVYIIGNEIDIFDTENLTKRVREMSSQLFLFYTTYLSIPLHTNS